MKHIANALQRSDNPRVIETGPSSLSNTDRLARNLGWFSIGLGIADGTVHFDIVKSQIELSDVAVYQASRVRNEFRAPSVSLNLGLTTGTIQTLTVLDDFDPEVHVFNPRILAGSSMSLTAPDISTVTVDPDRPSRRSILSTYTVPAGTSVVRSVPTGTTSNIVNVFFIQNTALFAL